MKTMSEKEEYIPSELEEINLAVAAIAGWTDIKTWNPKAIKKTFVGSNLAHPELGIFMPDYVGSLDAIVKIFRVLEIPFDFAYSPNADLENEAFIAWSCLAYRQEANSPALALCKLLLAINPEPIKPLPIAEKEEIKSTIIEASF